jgi:hypothetical protein
MQYIRANCYRAIKSPNVLVINAYDAAKLSKTTKTTTEFLTPSFLHMIIHITPLSSPYDDGTAHSIIIKDLIRILQYRLDNLALEPGVGQIRVSPHERRPEHDG